MANLQVYFPWKTYSATNYSFRYPLFWSVSKNYNNSYFIYNTHQGTYQLVNTRDRNRGTSTEYGQKIIISEINDKDRIVNGKLLSPAEYAQYLCARDNAYWYYLYPNSKGPLPVTYRASQNLYQIQCSAIGGKFYLYNNNTILEINPLYYLNPKFFDKLISSIKF